MITSFRFMNQLPIDVDAEAIFLDGNWYTREDLARKIKSMIDAGDFGIARPSAALEALSQTLQAVRTLSFRCTPDFAEALSQLAARTENSVGQLVREAVMQLLTQSATSGPTQESLRREETVKSAMPTPPEAQPIQLMQPAPHPQAAPVMAGPGALRNAGLDPRSEQANQGQGEGAENRWFKQ